VDIPTLALALGMIGNGLMFIALSARTSQLAGRLPIGLSYISKQPITPKKTTISLAGCKPWPYNLLDAK
jgi:hypothetical protein